MGRMVIILDLEVKETILQVAQREARDPRQQAGLLLREALERRGLLPLSDTEPKREGQHG